MSKTKKDRRQEIVNSWNNSSDAYASARKQLDNMKTGWGSAYATPSQNQTIPVLTDTEGFSSRYSNTGNNSNNTSKGNRISQSSIDMGIGQDEFMNVANQQEQVKQNERNRVNAQNDYSNSLSNDDKISLWLSDGYKLTKQEKKQAKDLIKAYDAVGKNPNVDYMTDAEKEEMNRYMKLKDKTSTSEAVAYGALKATPGADALLTLGDDGTDYGYKSRKNAVIEQNPLAYTSGQLGTTVAYSMALQNLLGGTGYGNAIEGATQKALGDNVASKIVADSLMDAPVDLATDTIPELLSNIADGKSSKETAIDTAKNIALNTALNTGAATLSNFDDIIPALSSSRSKKVIDTAGDVAETVDAAGTPAIKSSLENANKNEVNAILDKRQSLFENALADDTAEGHKILDKFDSALKEEYPELYDAKGYFVGDKNARQIVDEAAKKADISPVELAKANEGGIPELAKQAEEATANIEELGKQVPEVPQVEEAVSPKDAAWKKTVDKAIERYETKGDLSAIAVAERMAGERGDMETKKMLSDIISEATENPNSPYAIAGSFKRKTPGITTEEEYDEIAKLIAEKKNPTVPNRTAMTQEEWLQHLKDKEAKAKAEQAEIDDAIFGAAPTESVAISATPERDAVVKAAREHEGAYKGRSNTKYGKLTKDNGKITDAYGKETSVNDALNKIVKNYGDESDAEALWQLKDMINYYNDTGDAAALDEIKKLAQEFDAKYEGKVMQSKGKALSFNGEPLTHDKFVGRVSDIVDDLTNPSNRIFDGMDLSDAGIDSLRRTANQITSESYHSLSPEEQDALWESYLKQVNGLGLEGKISREKTAEITKKIQYMSNANKPSANIVDDVAESIPVEPSITADIPEETVKADSTNEDTDIVSRLFGEPTDVPPGKDLPANGAKRGKVSQTRDNSLVNSGINTEDELNSTYLDRERFVYEDEHEYEQMARDISEIAKDPKGEYDKLMSKTFDEASEDDVNKLFMYYTKLTDVARESENSEAWEQAAKTFKQIQELGTDRAKGLQAFAKWNRNTKEGIVADGLRAIRRNLEKEFGEKTAKDVVDKIIDSELKNIDGKVSKAMAAGIDSREAKKIFAEIGKELDRYTPKTYRGKLQTILMDNMLGNFRTLVSRNAGGNIGYNLMEDLRQPITALYDRALSKVTGKRTRTGWSKDKIAAQLSGMKKGLAEEVDDLVSDMHTAKSGENTLANAIDLNKHSFSIDHKNNGGAIYNALGLDNVEAVNKFMDASGKVANKLDDLVKHGLSVGDRPFYEGAFAQRLAELRDLRAKNLLGEDIAKLTDEQFEEMAQLSAKLDGLSATYQDDSKMAAALTNLKQFAGNASEGLFGFDILSQFSSPFVRTPGNIIDKAVDYSPLGFVKRYGEAASNRIRGQEFDQQRFADQAGRNWLGSLAMAGGYGLASSGALNGSYSDDTDMKAAQRNSGMIEYGLNMGNGNMDISWLPVLGSDLIAGSAIQEALNESEDKSIPNAVKTGTSEMISTLFDQSAMQGAQRLLGGTNSYSTDGVGANIYNTLESGLSQGVPSLVRQIANVSDDYQRNISEGDRSYAINNVLSGIPGVRQSELLPKVDNEGNLVLQNQGRGTASKIFENMFLPGQFKEYQTSPLDEEAMRIFDAADTQGYVKQFNTSASRSDITTKEYTPTDEDFYKYSVEFGSAKRNVGNTVLSSDFYKGLSNDEKAKVLSDIYTGIKAATKTNYVDGYSTDNKIANAYLNGNTDGVMEYLSEKYYNESLTKELSSYGLGSSSSAKAYTKAQGVIPELTTEEFAKTFKSIDKNGDGNIRKSEFLDYANKKGISKSDMKKQYDAYGGSFKIPVLKDGVWK